MQNELVEVDRTQQRVSRCQCVSACSHLFSVSLYPLVTYVLYVWVVGKEAFCERLVRELAHVVGCK